MGTSGAAAGAEEASAGMESGRGRRWGRLFCGLGLAGALAGLALPWATAFWLGFDVFSQFTVHFLILAAGCAAGLIWPRRGILVALVLVILGVLGIGLWAMLHKSPGAAAAARGEGVLRVMSFNTWARNADVGEIAAEVRRQQPDIVGMMEFVPPKARLRGLLRQRYPHQADCTDRPHCYLALFSRWPIEKVSARSLWEGPPYLHAVVRTPQGRVHVFVVHTLRFPWLGSQLKQVRAMARIVRRTRGARIVMGDFNATPFSVMLHTFVRNSGLRRQTWLPTWPAWMAGLPQLAIDHVFISPGLARVGGPWIGNAAGSDHYPVIVDVRLPGR
jgi:endonuclease/exonuclease/phosphatase (EEP) superfamily protein YafD